MSENDKMAEAEELKRWREILQKAGGRLLRGERVELKTPWEKVIGVHMGLGLLVEMTYKNMAELGNQVNSDFDHKLDNREQIALTPDSKRNVVLYVKIKNDCNLINGFYTKAEKLQAYSQKLDARLLPASIYQAYITSFATMKELAESIRKMHLAIVTDLPACFSDAVKNQGFDLAALENEVLRSLTVNKDAEQKVELLKNAIEGLDVRW